jgi:hypothetical protein
MSGSGKVSKVGVDRGGANRAGSAEEAWNGMENGSRAADNGGLIPAFSFF